MFQSAGRITIPGNWRALVVCNQHMAVSIRRADHDTWEQAGGAQAEEDATPFQSAGRITIPGNRSDSHTFLVAYPDVSIRRADHDTWELCGLRNSINR